MYQNTSLFFAQLQFSSILFGTGFFPSIQLQFLAGCVIVMGEQEYLDAGKTNT
jgi:hypothetical protein